MKNFVICVLAIVVCVLISSIAGMSKRASYWMNRCDAAEEVIGRVESDNEDYVLDVLCESNEWFEWTELGGDE